MRALMEGIAVVCLLGGIVWLPLLPALVWGKRAIPIREARRILGRSARLSVLAGAPMAFLGLLLFAHLNPDHPPSAELARRSAVLALAGLPLYGAMVTTSVFQEHHRASTAPRRHFVVRLLAGIVILATNLFAAMYVFFVLFAVSGVYRGWN
jgi:hypothetical protein